MDCVSTRGYCSPINIPSLPSIREDSARRAARRQWRAERKEKERRKREEEVSEFITIYANKKVPLYNSLSLSAWVPESQSGKSACLQCVYVTEMCARMSCYIYIYINKGEGNSNYMFIKSRIIDVEHRGFTAQKNTRPLMELKSKIEYSYFKSMCIMFCFRHAAH